MTSVIRLAAPPAEFHVDVGIDDLVLLAAAPDLEIGRRPVGAVDQVMAVAPAGRKARDHAGPHRLLAGVCQQDELAVDDEDELVLVAVPVALRRPAAGRQMHEVDAELGEPEGIAQRAFGARRDRCRERLRIA